MKAPTLIFCLLASLSSLVYAVPFQRRQIGRLQECQAQLDKDVTTFTNTVSALDINLDITVVLVSYELRIIVGVECSFLLASYSR